MDETNVSGKVLSIQSHTVTGYVGNRSAVFPMQLLGLEVDAIHTVQFSNHTGAAYQIVCGKKMAPEEFLSLLHGLETNDMLRQYTHVITGYIGNLPLLQALEQLVLKLATAPTRPMIVIDPVLGDHGKFYVPEECLAIYQQTLLPHATLVTPNQFECEVLTGQVIKTRADAMSACRHLHELGPTYVVVTSCLVSDTSLTVITSERVHDVTHDHRYYTQHSLTLPSLQGSYTGTGDLFTALLVARMVQYPTDFLLAVKVALQNVAAVLTRTSTANSTELRLIQSRQDLLCPCPKDRPLAQVLVAPIQAVIFDLDGTLTMPHLLDFTPIKTQFGLTGADFLADVMALSPPQQALALSLIHVEEARVCASIVFQPGVAQLLSFLAESQIACCLATRNTHASVIMCLAALSLSPDFFTTILTRESEVTKPDPEVAYRLCEAMSVPPSHVLFVGDSIDDIECGRTSGCQTSVLLHDFNQSLATLVDHPLTALVQVETIITSSRSRAALGPQQM